VGSRHRIVGVVSALTFGDGFRSMPCYAVAAMPRYEFSDGKSNKFWEIELEGTSFTTTYGRIGTNGQTSMKEYDSTDKAKKEYDKLIAEKVKKGYKLVAAGAAKDAEDDEEEEEDEEE
jgi:predicted DNA-binding WGR domain protein